jgi:hypothetical protein
MGAWSGRRKVSQSTGWVGRGEFGVKGAEKTSFQIEQPKDLAGWWRGDRSGQMETEV